MINTVSEVLSHLVSITKGGYKIIAAFSVEEGKLTTLVIRVNFFSRYIRHHKKNLNSVYTGRNLSHSEITTLAREISNTEVKTIDINMEIKGEAIRILNYFSPRFWSHRGVCLIDIQAFSQMRAEDQLQSRLQLENIIFLAARFLENHVHKRILEKYKIEENWVNSFRKISTGDGFFILHERAGTIYDLLTFALTMLVHSHANKSSESDDFNLNLYSGFGIGELYTFYSRIKTINALVEKDLDNCLKFDGIGPILNEVSRICGFCKPSQILVKPINELLDSSVEEISDLNTMVEFFNTQLFDLSDASIQIDPQHLLMHARDKHQNDHYFYNITGSVPSHILYVDYRDIGLKYNANIISLDHKNFT